jgi:hypothetical protein
VVDDDARWVRNDPGIRLALGSVALIAIMLVAAGIALGSSWTLVVLLVVVVVASLRAGTATGAALGVLCWGLDNGFLEHRYGELTFSGDDVRRLALLAGVGTLAAYASTRRDHSLLVDWSVERLLDLDGPTGWP